MVLFQYFHSRHEVLYSSYVELLNSDDDEELFKICEEEENVNRAIAASLQDQEVYVALLFKHGCLKQQSYLMLIKLFFFAISSTEMKKIFIPY